MARWTRESLTPGTTVTLPSETSFTCLSCTTDNGNSAPPARCHHTPGMRLYLAGQPCGQGGNPMWRPGVGRKLCLLYAIAAGLGVHASVKYRRTGASSAVK